MIDRKGCLEKISFQFDVHPTVAILGPRQCGKTTLAQVYAGHTPAVPAEHVDPSKIAHVAPKYAMPEKPRRASALKGTCPPFNSL